MATNTVWTKLKQQKWIGHLFVALVPDSVRHFTKFLEWGSTCARQCPALSSNFWSQHCNPNLEIWWKCWSLFSKSATHSRNLAQVLDTVQHKSGLAVNTTAFMRKGNQATTSFFVVIFSSDSVNNVFDVLIAQPCDKCGPKNLPRSKQTDVENSNFRTSRPCALHVAGL